MVSITEQSPQKGDIEMELPIKQAIDYIKEKQGVYVYVDGKLTKIDNLELVLKSDEQHVDIAIFLTGGRERVSTPVSEYDAINMADKIGGVWIYNTFINKFAQLGKIVLQSKEGTTLYEKRV